MTLREINFDGIVGPSHNYAGLSFGNVASMGHAGQVSQPRAAALQGIDGAPIPAHGFGSCSAPEVFAHVQHVVAKVFELIVRGLAAAEVFAVVVQEQVVPALGIGRA